MRYLNNTRRTKMTTKLLQTALLRAQAKKGKKANGFTLIELMVVVAIVGVLSAVGLPELTKAQDRAKNATATATLTNAAKECSLSLISLGDDTDYTGGTADSPFENVDGDCAVGETLELESETGDTATVTFVGSIPGVVTITEATAGGG